MAGSPSSHDWQRTVVKSETVTFTWNVEGFDSLRKLARLKALPSKDRLFSPEFGTTSAGRWKVALFPYGDRETQRFVSLYLFGDKLQRRVAEFSMVVLDKDFREVPDTFLGEEPTFFTPESSSWGWHEFLSVENDDELRGFLVGGDCLRVKITVKVYIGVVDDDSPRLLFNIVQHRCEHSDVDEISDNNSECADSENCLVDDSSLAGVSFNYCNHLQTTEKPAGSTNEPHEPQALGDDLQKQLASQRYDPSASTSRLTRAGTFLERSSQLGLTSGPLALGDVRSRHSSFKTLIPSSSGCALPLASSRAIGSSGSAAPNPATNAVRPFIPVVSAAHVPASDGASSLQPLQPTSTDQLDAPAPVNHSQSLVTTSTGAAIVVSSKSSAATAASADPSRSFKSVSTVDNKAAARRRKTYCCCSSSAATDLINGKPFTGVTSSTKRESDRRTSLNIRGQALQLDVGSFAADPRTHDVVVRSGNLRVPAIRFLLGARSAVLREMLFGPFVEGGQQEVEVSDVEPDVLKDFVTFLMTDSCEALKLPFNCRCGCGRSSDTTGAAHQCPETKEKSSVSPPDGKGTEAGRVCRSLNCTGCVTAKDAKPIAPRLLSLLIAADKYHIEELRSRCIQSLARCICASTVLDILDHAEKLQCDSLVDACKFYLRSNSSKLGNVVDHMRRQRRRSSVSTATSSVGIATNDLQMPTLIQRSTSGILSPVYGAAVGLFAQSKAPLVPQCSLDDPPSYLMQSRWLLPSVTSLSVSSTSSPSETDLGLCLPPIPSALNNASLPSCSGPPGDR